MLFRSRETEVEDGVAAMIADILEINKSAQKEAPKQEKKKELEISEPIEISDNENINSMKEK